MKRLLTILLLGLVAVLVVPVLVGQFRERESRAFRWVDLDETEHREIGFRNDRQNLRLAGLVFVPDGEGPFPAAVVIHGSGTSRRDNGWYVTLARHLQRRGILVLLPDKRGSENSEGQWQTASYEDLATDTMAAVSFLRTQGGIAVHGIGVVGLSQGGRIAPIVAREDPDLAYVVNVVGGAVPAHESLVYEETYNLREIGMLPGVSDVIAYPAAWSIIYLRQKDHWDAVGNFDPIRYWREVEVPALVLYGESDTNVKWKKSAERLRALGKPHIQVRTYPGSGHALEDAPGQGHDLFRADALDDISDFILEAVSTPG